MDILETIAAFREALQKGKTADEVASWWDWCEKIEWAIETDSRATPNERQAVEALKLAVSNGILVVRDLHGHPDRGRISAVLIGLQHSIERRTIGPDGYPMR
jgi:hypothetical protein